MRELTLDHSVIRQLLDDDEFYRFVPEFHYLRETVKAMKAKGPEGCQPCQAQRDAVAAQIPQTLARHIVLLHRDYGDDGLQRLKRYVQARSPETRTCVLYYRDVPTEALQELRF